MLWTNLTVSLLRDADGEPQYQLALLEDTTERRLLHLRLRYEATHDALTGLPNRTLFFERLEKAVTRPDGHFSLCYLDLDGFKTVNDSLGHAAGDRLLVEVADRLQSCATAPGEMVARLGGDEFVALTTDPRDEPGHSELAGRILQALEAPIRIDGRELLVRGSIGVVDGPTGERGPAEVLRSADITMYRAKSAGGNRFELADPESDARAITRHALTTALPAALERGEFFIEYQPLVHLGDGSVRGAEALVRWAHPQHGVLGPDRFIPLAEHTGLIVPLGRWVLEGAVRQARRWQGADTGPVRINVNVSPMQLHHPGLVADTVDILEREGLEPGALCLELTESALIGADDDLLKPLRRLSEMGVDIALDDFGTGYSNLANLRRLPVSVLKLDRSFTRGCSSTRPTPSTGRSSRGSSRSPTAWTSRSPSRAWRPAPRPTPCGNWAATPPRAGSTPARARPTGCTPWTWWTPSAEFGGKPEPRRCLASVGRRPRGPAPAQGAAGRRGRPGRSPPARP